MAKSIPEPFARGSGRPIADALEPVLAKVRELRKQGVGGPWMDVLDTLHAVYWALLTRNASTVAELAATAEALHRKALLKAISRENRNTARLFLLIEDVVGGKVLRHPRSQRLEALADFFGGRSNVRLAIYQAAKLLPDIAPELPFKYAASDNVFRPHLFADRESMLNDLSAFAAENNLPAKTERKLGRIFAKQMTIPAPGDGRGIVRSAARFLGVDKKTVDGLFGAEYAKAYRARRRQRKAAAL